MAYIKKCWRHFRYIEILCKDNKGSRRLYDIFLEKIMGKIKAETKWESALNRNID